MKQSLMLTIASLLSILFMTFHLADDIVRGIEPGGVKNFTGVLILAVWLYGTLVLAERRSGYVIVLLGSLLGSAVPAVHMRGSGLVGGEIASSSGVFFWVWTLLALGVTAIFSLVLSARGLRSLLWASPGEIARQSSSQQEGLKYLGRLLSGCLEETRGRQARSQR